MDTDLASFGQGRHPGGIQAPVGLPTALSPLHRDIPGAAPGDLLSPNPAKHPQLLAAGEDGCEVFTSINNNSGGNK